MSANRFEDVFNAARVDGFLHARDLASGKEIGWQSDAPVVTASVFKLPVLVELYRQADAGRIDLSGPVTVPVADRAPGPTGLSVMLDPVTMSWRDLALSMMVVSDNAATDVICAKLGLANVNATMRALGLPNTVVEGDCRALFATLYEDAGVKSAAEFPAVPTLEQIHALRAMQPLRTNRSTPRETARLLELIWTDQAASKAGCAQIRRILSAQVWPHRLASGFPEDPVKTAGKTGTLILVRNESCMVTLPGPRHVAVSVFTRARDYRAKHPAQDRVIGTAARLAVEALVGEIPAA